MPEPSEGGDMTAIGSYRFALRPDTDEAEFETAGLAALRDTPLQLTRVTSRFDDRLLAVSPWGRDADGNRHPRPQYVWEVTVFLVSRGSSYDFDANADRIQAAVGDLATLVSVEHFRPVSDPVPERT